MNMNNVTGWRPNGTAYAAFPMPLVHSEAREPRGPGCSAQGEDSAKRPQSPSMNSGSPNRRATVPTSGSIGITSERHSPSLDGSPQGFLPCDCRQIVHCQTLELAVCVAQRNAIHHHGAVSDSAKARHHLEIAADHCLHFFQ